MQELNQPLVSDIQHLVENRWMARNRKHPLSPLGRVITFHLERPDSHGKKRTKAQMAIDLSVTEQSVNKWLNTGKISKEKLEELSAYLPASMNDLVNGVVPEADQKAYADLDIHFSQVEDELITLEPGPILAKAAKVPVVGSAQLGEGYRAELEYPVGHGDGYINYSTKDKGAYALRCKGDSMRPRIRDGEFVVILPSHPINPNDEVLIKCIKGRVMVKTFKKVTKELVYLESINENFPEITIPINDIESMQYVAAIVKKAEWEPE
jgi:phage repressor protein C with HTH and peptisase S24 domain